MPTKAKSAKQTLVQRGDDAGSVFTTIGEVTGFNAPPETTDSIDATSMDSSFKEFISSGLPDAGEVKLDVLFVGSNAEQQGLRADVRSGFLRAWKILLNDHATTKTTFAFNAVVIGFDGPSAGSPTEAYKASVTLKVSGQPTVTYAPA